MKNNKMLVVGLMGLVFGLFSQVNAFEFDLLNKTGKTVQVFVKDMADGKGIATATVGNREPCHIKTNDSPKTVFITVKIPSDSYVSTYTVTINGKTCYVTYGDKNGVFTLYPQTGKLGGFSGKTESGYPLDKGKNVNAGDIRD